MGLVFVNNMCGAWITDDGRPQHLCNKNVTHWWVGKDAFSFMAGGPHYVVRGFCELHGNYTLDFVQDTKFTPITADEVEVFRIMGS